MRGVIADDGRSKRFHALILYASMSREAGYCSAFQLSHCQRKAALGLASSVLSLHPKSLNCNPDYISVFDGVSWFDRKLTCVMESQGFVARWHGMPGRMLLFAAGPCGPDVVRKWEGDWMTCICPRDGCDRSQDLGPGGRVTAARPACRRQAAAWGHGSEPD